MFEEPVKEAPMSNNAFCNEVIQFELKTLNTKVDKLNENFEKLSDPENGMLIKHKMQIESLNSFRRAVIWAVSGIGTLLTIAGGIIGYYKSGTGGH